MSQILLYFFNNCLSLAKKDIYLVLSKFLAYPLIFGNMIYTGVTNSSFLQPIKYFKLFLPQGNSADLDSDTDAEIFPKKLP